MTYDEMKGATSRELMAFYNLHVRPAVKKWENRAAAERRCAALIARLEDQARLKFVDEALDFLRPPIADQEINDRIVSLPAPGPVPVFKPMTRSEGARVTWKDPDIRERRSRRHGVAVDGLGEYESLLEAFKLLGIPTGSHIKFRGMLKKCKVLEGYGYTFRLIDK